MTPEERAERERRELIYRRHAEMQVIQLAIKDHRGCAPEWCGGSGLDPCGLFNAIEDLERRYARTGAPLAEAFEREAEALVRQLDAPAEKPTRSAFEHPSDPSQCVNELGWRSGPEDCVINHPASDELIWHPRTMKDARKGDQIRPAGSDMPNGTKVTDRYWPPQPAVPTRYGPLPADRDTWHVVPGAKHWDDHVVQPGEVWLCLDGTAPRNVDPDFPIEILLTRAEIAAIELLGWDNREETRS